MHVIQPNAAGDYHLQLSDGMQCDTFSPLPSPPQGMTLLMMGSAEALPEEPAVRPMFVEDMTEDQLASAVSSCSLAGSLIAISSTVFKLALRASV